MTRVLGERGELPTGDSKRRAVEGMFDRLAPSYDRMNRVISLGQDKRWRRHTVEALLLPPKSLVLDVACGTGDLCRDLASFGAAMRRLAVRNVVTRVEAEPHL